MRLTDYTCMALGVDNKVHMSTTSEGTDTVCGVKAESKISAKALRKSDLEVCDTCLEHAQRTVFGQEGPHYE